MSLADTLFGRPLATSEERAEHIGVAAGIPIFGLDALTSAAYGPETALSLLIPLGLMAVEEMLQAEVATLAGCRYTRCECHCSSSLSASAIAKT